MQVFFLRVSLFFVKPKPAPAVESPARGELGAPAALRAIEEHELRCRQEKDEARTVWRAAVGLPTGITGTELIRLGNALVGHYGDVEEGMA